MAAERSQSCKKPMGMSFAKSSWNWRLPFKKNRKPFLTDPDFRSTGTVDKQFHGRSPLRLDKKFAISALALILLVAAAFYVFAGEQRRDRETSLEEIDRLNEVLTRVLDYYVEEKDLGEVIDDAIRGILEELDPHSVYLDKRQYENLMIDTKGEFGGLGITITVREGFPTVISPIEDTPAFRMGIQAGDRIIAIEGEPTAGWSSDEAVGKLRGAPGTQVNITVDREAGHNKIDSLDVTITRFPCMLRFIIGPRLALERDLGF